ncbi:MULTISPECIES: NHL domain-containing thioredoxin family protein [Streptomyces]|uniref:NHL domain-containing thioredoxin family protein n=1 Tax=Streptomyces TaxID=1883 RepID=UPI00129271C9|nr:MULTISPECIES: NHL domain-containing thioredoxin family protein [Streptomyces]MCX5040942.1 NHL domain-containing thioredoxin family protein [Streptomyces coelicoflavus]QFX80002.1 redoxin domain-containing protein [Streptomyces sp. SYP-A7193]
MAKRARVRAPELVGKGGWIRTGGREPTLAALRGRIVVVDFWKSCCINCLHVLDELRELGDKHRETVVIVGVHSPKFAHEADHRAVVDAVERYDVEHPVLDDPELATWQQYAVRAWPTLAVIDPEGYVVAQYSGEGHADAVEQLVGELEAEHAAKGTLRRGDAPYAVPEPEPTSLRFPGKVLLLPSGTFLVSDTTRHRLVELAQDGESVVRRVGSGERGRADGPAEGASFNEPQGLALLDDGCVVVADTANHTLRRFDPATGEVATLAGTGRQWTRGGPTSGPALEIGLSSPWDVALWNGRVWIAMAGMHQLWAYDPRDGSVDVAAGTTDEGLVDGPGPQAWFAQPSGLAATEDRLWVADSETSALRWVDLEGTVRTAVGTGLFDFGHRDGPAAQALLQHPLGVTALPDGSVVVADTYNHALRRYDTATGDVSTLATDLREPSDAVVVGEDVLVVESARHRLTRLRLPREAVGTAGRTHGTRREVTEVAPGTLRLEVVFRAPGGQTPDTRYGPSTRLLVSATPPALLSSGAGAGTVLSRLLEADPAVPDGVLHVSATAVSCDDDPATPYPACHVHQRDWDLPIRLADGATDRLSLVLADPGDA